MVANIARKSAEPRKPAVVDGDTDGGEQHASANDQEGRVIVALSSTRTRRVSLSANRRIRPVLRNKEDWPEAAEHSRSRTRNQRWIDFLGSTPVANTETMLLVYGLFQKGRVLAQDGIPIPAIVSLGSPMRVQ